MGASHMTRIAAAMAEGGATVNDLSTPGWVATKESIARLTSYVDNAKLGKNDLLVIDLFSNCSFMGTDEAGMPRKATRSPVDGKYHLIGQLQAAPRTMYHTLLTESKSLLNAAGEARVLVVAPFPRYVPGKCCDDPTHITNFGTDEYYSEMYRVGDHMEAAVNAAQISADINTFHMMDNLVGNDSDLPELRTAGGGQVWRMDDPVHLKPEAFAELAGAMLHTSSGDSEGNPAKRPRLSSVVPPTRGVGGRMGKVRPPSWVAGLAARGGGSGPYQPTRGGGFTGWRSAGGRARMGRGVRGRGRGSAVRFVRGPRRGGYDYYSY